MEFHRLISPDNIDLTFKHSNQSHNRKLKEERLNGYKSLRENRNNYIYRNGILLMSYISESGTSMLR